MQKDIEQAKPSLEKKLTRGTFDLPKKLASSSSKTYSEKKIMLGSIALAILVVGIIVGVETIIDKHHSRQYAITSCTSRMNTVDYTFGDFDRDKDKITMKLTGYATSAKTPLIVDGSVVKTSTNQLDAYCKAVGVELYKIEDEITLSDCSIKKVGFRVEEKDIEVEPNITMACDSQSSYHQRETERQECESKPGYMWNNQKLTCIEKQTSSNSSSSSSSANSSSKRAYGSDPNDPDTYTGAGESIKEKQLRAHILCKNYAEDYFYPDKVSFSSITGVVTDEEQYYGWRYDVMMDVKSAAGGKKSYIMHCIAGGFNTKDYSDGKVTLFEALPR